MATAAEFLRSSPLVRRLPRTTNRSVLDVLEADGIHLPSEYREIAEGTRAVMAYGGYFRIFGAEWDEPLNVASWNADATWKFAWPPHAKDYFCVGENAFGDQYAFRIEELGRSVPPVYLLDGVGLQPEPLAPSFGAFVHDEFMRNAAQPYDSMVVSARARLGDLELSEHVIQVPSILITGAELPENLVKMTAISSMTINGDLATQLSNEPESRRIARLDTYEDANGRTRISVVWEDQLDR